MLLNLATQQHWCPPPLLFIAKLNKSIQQFLSLSNGGGLKITIEEYYTPNRTKINGVGITPDVEVELEQSVTGLPTDQNDTQLNKAKEILKSEQ